MQIADHPKPLAPAAADTLSRYRRELLAAGFQEPVQWTSSTWHWLFYKPLTELTAFVVNLQGHDEYISVVYGCASTAFTRMAGDSDALTSLGVTDGEISLRSIVHIADAGDEPSAASRVRQMHDSCINLEKDALLAIVKEQRKAFIQRISVRLKPLGFRKKGNTWVKAMPEGFELTFYLQKSSYSDRYYFNVSLRKADMRSYGACYDARIAPEYASSGKWCMDWQLTPAQAIDSFLDTRVLPVLTWLLDTPYAVLGTQSALWQGCSCQRQHCPDCWVDKNLWEARSK